MYAYNRFWNAEKAMLLYPGENKNKSFREFRTDDYVGIGDEVVGISHQCKMGFVSVLDVDNNLNSNVGKQALELIEVANFYQ